MLSSLHALSHLILSMIFKKGVFLLIPFYNWVNPSLTRLSRSSKITQAHVHTHTHTHTHPVYCQDANWRNLMLRMCSSPPQWCLGETSVGWSLPRSCVNTQGCWYGWLLCTPLPGTHSFVFRAFKVWTSEQQRNLYLGLEQAQGAPMYDPWVLSTPLRSDLFLESTDYHNPTEKHGQSLALPWETESFYWKIKEITPTTVWMEESTSERLHLEGHVLLPSSTAEVHSREAGMMNPDTIFSKAEFSKCVFPNPSYYLHMRSVPPLMLLPKLTSKLWL